MYVLENLVNAEGSFQTERAPPMVTWSITPPRSDIESAEDSCETTTVMPEPEEEEPRRVYGKMTWSTRDIKTLWQECRRAKVNDRSLGRRNQSFWATISRKMSTGRTPNACCKKYYDLQSMAVDVRRLLTLEGLFWDQNRFCVDGSPEAWTALSSDESMFYLMPYRGKAVNFLSLDDLAFPERRKRSQPDNDGEEDHDQEEDSGSRTRRRRDRPAQTRNRIPTRANHTDDGDEGDYDELGLNPVEDHGPLTRNRQRHLIRPKSRVSTQATPAPEDEEETQDEGPDIQDIAQALPPQAPPPNAQPPPSTGPQPPSTMIVAQDEEKRSLQKRVRDRLKKDEKEGTWLKTAGRVKATEILRENVLLADDYVEEEDDEARKIFLKGILRGRYDGNLRAGLGELRLKSRLKSS